MINYLQAENIGRRIGERVLFEGISLTINKDDRMALIAVNGAGKSSLLDILAGIEAPDGGSVSLRRGLRIAYLRQDPGLNDSNRIIDELFAGGNAVADLIREYEECLISGSQDNMQVLVQQMDDMKAWDYEVKVKQILSKLGLTELNARIGNLSGGQQKRVALAKILVKECDLLILDEPTNHLDLEMTAWLEDYLLKSGKTMLMVTHDRYFLDRICNVILELSGSVIYRYEGNYEYFLEKRQEREEASKANVEKARNLLKTELDWIRRMPRARRHKSKSRIDSFHTLKEKTVLKTDQKSISINAAISRMGKKILDIKNLSKSYDNRILLKNFSYSFNRFEKVGLVGPNGAGKTTLLDIVTGSIPPDSGIIEKGETIVFGYYRQEGISFDDEMTVADAVKKIAERVTLSDGTNLSASQFLNYFLFPPDRQFTLIRKLSGGEKRRLYLLTVLMRNPNFLILDEPTNDLDILTLNVLEDYLAGFKGCVIVVSHDRYFMDKVVDHIFEFRGNGVIRDFPGNYTQLRDQYDDVSDYREDEMQPQKTQSKTATPRAKTNDRKGLSFNEKKELEQLTGDIEELESEKKQIEKGLSEGYLSGNELIEKSVRHGEVLRLLDEKELRWLELSEKQDTK